MTDRELQAIKERANKATSGPWILTGDNGAIKNSELSYVLEAVGSNGKTGEIFAYTSDIDFIIQAREDVPALIEEVERLREALQTIANKRDVDFGNRYANAAYMHSIKTARKALKGEYND